MLESEIEMKSEDMPKNGASTQLEVVQTSIPESSKSKTAQPWIAAGYKSRSEWRASKQKRNDSPPKPAVKASAVAAKKPAKKAKKPAVKAAAAKPAKKAKAKVVAKGTKARNYPTTAAERRKSRERTLQFMKSSAKREEPNKDEAVLLKAVKVGSTTTIELLAEKFSGNNAKRKSRVRNALRWCVASKRFKKVERGEYKRLK